MFKHLLTRVATLFKPQRVLTKRDEVLPGMLANAPVPVYRHGRSKEERSLVKLRARRKIRMRIQRASRQANQRTA